LGASTEAIGLHYDVGNDFFGLWLDPDMVYSCAMFEGREDLHTAQLRKLDYHIRESRATHARRVLDIGCGWGALLRRLVRGGVRTAVGLTLSRSQVEKIERDNVPGTCVRGESWQHHVADAPYDAIISIGAFEHFARGDLLPEEKVDAYRQFFDFCHRNLRTGGRLSLQTIAYRTHERPLDSFMSKVFPESDLPDASEIRRASDARFELLVSRDDRDDYYRTCRLWAKNLAARRTEAVGMVGQETTRNFEEALAIFTAGFKVGAFSLLRLTFGRRD
jgi:cyclopropane-fatty-acyl-phospholipid synthase